MSDHSPDDARLWAQLRHATASAAAEPGPEMVAAYLDGRLNEADAAQVERWLAEDAEARHAFSGDMESAGAPAAAIRRAQAIVAPEKAQRGWFGLAGLLPRPALIASACAVALAFVGALELGASTYAAAQKTEDRVAAAIWSSSDLSDKPS